MMGVLTKEMKRSFEEDKSIVMVMKVINMDLA